MNDARSDPYEKFVRDKLSRNATGKMSEHDIVNLRKVADYVNYSNEFIKVIDNYGDKLLVDAPTSFLVAEAIFTISTLTGGQGKDRFNMAWESFIGFMKPTNGDYRADFDLDCALNGVRLGLEAGLDISSMVKWIAEYLAAKSTAPLQELEIGDILGVVNNHEDVISSVHTRQKLGNLSNQINDALKVLRANSRK